MSLITIISALEEERALNKTLLKRLQDDITADIQRLEAKYITDRAHLEQRRADLAQEFAERDAALMRLVDGNEPGELPSLTAVKEATDADLAA